MLCISSNLSNHLCLNFDSLLTIIKSTAMTNTFRCASESYNIHTNLEKLRTKACKENTKGPVTLIVGPTDVGKSTLTHSLLNLAANEGRSTFFIDLDVGQSSVSIPGTLGKLLIDNPCKVNEGFDEQELIVYFFGYNSPGANPQFYFHLMKTLSATLKSDLSSNKTKSSGAIIDTCGWVTGLGYDAIIHAALSFEIDVLLVVGDVELFHQLLHDISTDVKTFFIQKLKGVNPRNTRIRRQNRKNKIVEYFHGPQNELRPYTFDVSFSDVQICTVSTMKNSKQSNSSNFCVEYVSVQPELLYQVLAISHADRAEDITETSVYGFISFIDFDFDNKTIKVLSPQPKPLPNKLLLLGDIVLEMPNR